MTGIIKCLAKDPLVLDLAHVRERETRVERNYQPDQLVRAGEEAEDYTVTGPVELAFDLHAPAGGLKKDRHFRLTGGVKTTVEVTCSRCLERFSRAVDESFDLLYLPQAENKGDEEEEVEGDDLTTAYYQDDAVDLWQLMREQFYLSLPMKLLCSDACRGLCPHCGTNLNVRTCDCQQTWEDPRLAELRSFIDEKNHA